MSSSSGSDLVDLPRRLLPEDELEELGGFGAIGVRTADIGILTAGGRVGFVSSLDIELVVAVVFIGLS